MTATELINWMNDKFTSEGVSNPWPQTLNVSHETYANAVQFLINSKHIDPGAYFVKLAVGINNGVLFKGVELILEKKI